MLVVVVVRVLGTREGQLGIPEVSDLSSWRQMNSFIKLRFLD